MAHIELEIDTPLSPERVIGALTDFSERRPEIWPGLHPSLYEVHSVEDTWAEEKEGSRAPGDHGVGDRALRLVGPDTVTWTVKESNFCTPGSSVSAQVRPGPGSRIHVKWNRTGVGFKGRMLVGIIKLSGAKPVAASIKAGWDKMREQQPQSGKEEAMNQRVLLHEVKGQGDPIVPGGLSGWLSWIPHAERLSKERMVVRVQLRSIELAEAGEPFPDDYGTLTEREALLATIGSGRRSIRVVGFFALESE
jgi:hypothetical protein